MGTLASGSIDLKALKVAGEPNKYITKINDNGITVHAANNSSLNYVAINANGMEIFKSNGESTPSANSVASFGETVRIGATNTGNVIIQSSGIDFYGGDGTVNLAHIGYDSGEDAQGSTAIAPFYTFGTRQDNQPVGNYSVVEGFWNEASGYASHAEGHITTASGQYSHAEGTATEAEANDSHAEGIYTKAFRQGQHVEGMFNDVTNDTLYHIVGVGNGQNYRANGFAVDEEGNALVKKDVYVGCNDDSTGGNKLSPVLLSGAADNQGSVVIGDLVMEWGLVSITTGSSGTTTGGLTQYLGTAQVTFTNTFAYKPNVTLTWAANYNNQSILNTYDVTTTGFYAYGRTLTGSTTRSIRWIAIGKKA